MVLIKVSQKRGKREKCSHFAYITRAGFELTRVQQRPLDQTETRAVRAVLSGAGEHR